MLMGEAVLGQLLIQIPYAGRQCLLQTESLILEVDVRVLG